MDRGRAYAQLGLAPGASKDAIKAAFRSLAKEVHPDRAMHKEGAADRFAALKSAYDFLLRDSHMPEPIRTSAGRGTPGTDVGIEVSVPLETMAAGGTVPLPAPIPGGFGGTAWVPCPDCGGNGTRTIFKGIMRVRVTCSACSGTGRLKSSAVAPSLGAAGVVSLEVPPMTPDGYILRVPGAGGAGMNGRGDLLATVRAAPHPRFKPMGDDLGTTVWVSFADMCLGGSVEVTPLLPGRPLRVEFARGTAAGAVVPVAAEGLPMRSGTGRGKLLVRLLPRIPAAPTQEQVALLRQWKASEQLAQGRS
jgi:DnaJ-class molecular chaperone